MACARSLYEYGILLDRFVKRDAQPAGIHVLLSHAHADHMVGLTARWTHAPVHVSAGTRKLLELRFGRAAPLMAHLRVHPLKRWDRVTDEYDVAAVDAGHAAGSVVWLVRLTNGATFVYTPDYRPTPQTYRDLLALEVARPVSVLFLDSSFHDERVVLPSWDESVQALDRLAAFARRKRSRLAVVCHTGGTEQLVAQWCRARQATWTVDARTAKHPHQLRWALRDVAPAQEAKTAAQADAVCVGDTFPRARRGWTVCKPSAVWFLCHQPHAPFDTPVLDREGRWRIFYANHASYAENMDFIRFLSPQLVTSCVGLVRPDTGTCPAFTARPAAAQPGL